jgi:hypothetical protein
MEFELDNLKRRKAPTGSDWPEVSAALGKQEDTSLLAFKRDGDFLHKLYRKALAFAGEWDDLLRKTDWETLVFDFALFLECLYHESQSEESFEGRRFQLVRVLPSVAQRKEALTGVAWRGDNAFRAVIHRENRRFASGCVPDLFKTFFAYDALLEVEFLVNLYCHHGWTIDHVGMALCPPTADWWKRWNTASGRIHFMHIFYHVSPEIFDEKLTEFNRKSVSASHAEQQIATLSAQRFLDDLFGTDRIDQFPFAGPVDVLLRLVDCYTQNYHHVMTNAKQAGHPLALLVAHPGIMPCADIRSREYMIEMMSQYGHFPGEKGQRQCSRMLHLMSDAITDVDAVGTQFIRTKGAYIVMPRLFHGDVKTALFNNILTKKFKKSNVSRRMENVLEKLFVVNGYSTIKNYNFKRVQMNAAEADCIAYKDGHLFIVEAKQTHFRSTIHGVGLHASTLENKGKVQLLKMVGMLHDEFAVLKKRLDIKENFRDLTIAVLLVTVPMEFDLADYFPCRTVSLFELNGLLKPHYFMLVRGLIKAESQHKQEGASADTEDSIEIEQRLASQVATSPDMLLKALDGRWLWKGLDAHVIVNRQPQSVRLDLGDGLSVGYEI